MITFFNTLHHKVEEFKPLVAGKIGIYSCGPTVYWDAHIGNMYAYVVWDVAVRFLRWSGFEVKHVMNLTDVGHLTSDGNTGEDKMEKGARRENLTVWQVAEKYNQRFFESCRYLNIKRPDVVCKATDHIKEMIELIKKIEDNGYSYSIEDGIYFDTAKLKGYGEMAKLNLKDGNLESRLENVPGKKHPADFALWKRSPKNQQRQMEWDSPWGKGFPGWHIECTAMSVKHLGLPFDIHTGGIDHIPVHHTNEQAQSMAAFGQNSANYWLHNAHLTMKNTKISKSLGNVVLVQDLVRAGQNPLALRYLFLNSHYQTGVSFSDEALTAAENALTSLQKLVASLIEEKKTRSALSEEKNNQREKYLTLFRKAFSENLNYPKSLAVLWETAKSMLPAFDKRELLLEMDEVLGLDLGKSVEEKRISIPKKVENLVKEREKLRQKKDFAGADQLRLRIEAFGFTVLDLPAGPKIIRL